MRCRASARSLGSTTGSSTAAEGAGARGFPGGLLAHAVPPAVGGGGGGGLWSLSSESSDSNRLRGLAHLPAPESSGCVRARTVGGGGRK